MKSKKKTKKVKKKTTSQLKKELDKLVSEYVRRSYANNETCTCYTCSKKALWKEMQCGHFISRVYLATRFDLRNLRVQCIGCNIFGNGKNVEFARNLEEENPGIVQKLYRKAQEITKYFPYEQEIERYKGLINSLNVL